MHIWLWRNWRRYVILRLSRLGRLKNRRRNQNRRRSQKWFVIVIISTHVHLTIISTDVIIISFVVGFNMLLYRPNNFKILSQKTKNNFKRILKKLFERNKDYKLKIISLNINSVLYKNKILISPSKYESLKLCISKQSLIRKQTMFTNWYS